MVPGHSRVRQDGVGVLVLALKPRNADAMAASGHPSNQNSLPIGIKQLFRCGHLSLGITGPITETLFEESLAKTDPCNMVMGQAQTCQWLHDHRGRDVGLSKQLLASVLIS